LSSSADARIRKYLARWAEPEAASAAGDERRYFAALVVPVLGEPPSFLARFERALRAAPGRVSLILVVNASPDSKPELRAENERLLELLRGRAERRRVLRIPGDAYDVLLVDRSSPGSELPPKRGVGLARKLGGDLALGLFARGLVEAPLLFTTDADVELPADYFERALRELEPESGALLYPFEHVRGDDGEAFDPTLLYEMLLRYQVLGLAWAGSPYAYHSIGSTECVPFAAYSAVRGFPKRVAGEDFYLLDKASKIGPIRRLGGEPLRILARRSGRVPFGTGPRVEALLGGSSLRVPHPLAFAALARVHRAMARFARTGATTEFDPLGEGELGELAAPLVAAVERCGLVRAASEARAAVGTGSLLRRLHTWFDALRTLRFLHALRDAGLSDLPVLQALTVAPFTESCRPDALELALERLRALERELPVAVGPCLF
jgi:hypothetical protein